VERFCSRCKVWKSLSEFPKNGKLSKYRSICKDCRRIEQKGIYQKLPQLRKRSISSKNAACGRIRRAKNKKLAVEYLGGICKGCGLKTEIAAVYDCHHVDPTTKEYSISRALLEKSFEDIKTELDKCILLYSNCHRALHAIRGEI
jgi:hypothetical protein